MNIEEAMTINSFNSSSTTGIIKKVILRPPINNLFDFCSNQELLKTFQNKGKCETKNSNKNLTTESPIKCIDGGRICTNPSEQTNNFECFNADLESNKINTIAHPYQEYCMPISGDKYKYQITKYSFPNGLVSAKRVNAVQNSMNSTQSCLKRCLGEMSKHKRSRTFKGMNVTYQLVNGNDENTFHLKSKRK